MQWEIALTAMMEMTRNEPATEAGLKACYLTSLKAIERVHRQLLDVIKDEFDRSGNADVNAVQALLLFNIGDHEVTAGEIRTRGYYQGSNASYNIKKLVDAGYIDHQRSTTDRRSVRVRLTPRGKTVSAVVERLIARQMTLFEKVAGIDANDLRALNQTLARLERFWGDQIRYRM